MFQDHQNSDSNERKSLSSYDKAIQMKKEEIDLKKKKLAIYNEKQKNASKENQYGSQNDSKDSQDNKGLLLSSLKQKYSINENLFPGAHAQYFEDLKKKYAYMLKNISIEQKMPEETKSVVPLPNLNEKKEGLTLLDNHNEAINLKEFQQNQKKEAKAKNIRLANGKCSNFIKIIYLV